jgi:hypothetical protein
MCREGASAAKPPKMMLSYLKPMQAHLIEVFIHADFLKVLHPYAIPTCNSLFPAGRVVCVMHEHSEIANIPMSEEQIVYTITKPITFNKSTGQCEGMNDSGKSNSEHCVVF